MKKDLQTLLSDIQNMELEASKVELLEQQRLRELENLEAACKEEGLDTEKINEEISRLEDMKDSLLDKIIELCDMAEAKIDEALKDG